MNYGELTVLKKLMKGFCPIQYSMFKMVEPERRNFVKQLVMRNLTRDKTLITHPTFWTPDFNMKSKYLECVPQAKLLILDPCIDIIEKPERETLDFMITYKDRIFYLNKYFSNKIVCDELVKTIRSL
jgi:hypothetical protein